MLRLLPYLLILLVCLFFSKLMNVMEEYVGILNIQESKAQLDKPDLKKEDPKDLSINKEANIENLKKTDTSSNIQNDFQLNSEKQLLQQLRKRRNSIVKVLKTEKIMISICKSIKKVRKKMNRMVKVCKE